MVFTEIIVFSDSFRPLYRGLSGSQCITRLRTVVANSPDARQTRNMTPRQIRYDLGSPVSPSPHTRRLVSLSSVLDFSLSPESTSAETHEATQILDAILDAYSPPPDSSVRADHLISHLISLAPSPLGAQNITRQLLHFLFPPCSPSPEIPALSEILPRARIGRVNPHHCSQGVETFARDLLDLFFLPLLSAGGRTENPPSANSPTFLTTRSRAIHAPSPNRLSSLRHDLLKRDDACCVVTGYMDTSVYRRGPVPGVVTAKVEAAHIIPHALNAGDGELEEGKRFVWQVLNMFDPGVSHTLEGAQIDGTRNALLLQADLHHMWGQLLWWLEEVPVCI